LIQISDRGAGPGFAAGTTIPALDNICEFA
jgi:hypothetical protein